MEDCKVTYTSSGRFLNITFKVRKEPSEFEAFTAAQRGAQAGAIASALGYSPFVGSMDGVESFCFRRP